MDKTLEQAFFENLMDEEKTAIETGHPQTMGALAEGIANACMPLLALYHAGYEANYPDETRGATLYNVLSCWEGAMAASLSLMRSRLRTLTLNLPREE